MNNLIYADDTTLMAESKEELKSLLMKVKERKSGLKTQHSKNEDHDIWSHHFMANIPALFCRCTDPQSRSGRLSSVVLVYFDNRWRMVLQ